jgi:hypothetical protein
VSLAELDRRLAREIARGVVAHDAPRLRRPVEQVRPTGCGVDLAAAIAVHVADLDLVDERVGPAVELPDREGAPAVGRDDGDDALVVGRDHDGRDPAAQQVRDLRIAHAAVLASEVGLPERGGLEAPGALAPQLERGRRPAEREDAGAAARVVDDGLVKDVARRILERDRLPASAAVDEDLEPRGLRLWQHLARGADLELREGDEQAGARRRCLVGRDVPRTGSEQEQAEPA